MKTSNFLAWAVLSMMCLGLAGCATAPQAANATAPQIDKNSPRFHDSSKVNAVLRFSSWDYTFLVKPFYSENGFLQQVGRGNLDQVFDRLNVHRGTAVVMVGWTYRAEPLNQLVAEWRTILGGCGFQRVVFLRADKVNELNGSIIIDDSTLAIRSAQAPTFVWTATN